MIWRPDHIHKNRLLAVFAFTGLGRWIAGPQAQLSGVHWLAALRLETPVHPAVPTIFAKTASWRFLLLKVLGVLGLLYIVN